MARLTVGDVGSRHGAKLPYAMGEPSALAAGPDGHLDIAELTAGRVRRLGMTDIPPPGSAALADIDGDGRPDLVEAWTPDGTHLVDADFVQVVGDGR